MAAASTGAGNALSRANPLPLYAQLAEVLRDRITSGGYEPGAALPSEAELCAFFDVSRTAVRQALQELVDEGLIVKERGRGSFVRADQPTGLVVTEVLGFSHEMRLAGKSVETQVLDVRKVELAPDVCPLLNVPMGSHAVRLDRLRFVDDQPTVLVRTHLTSPRFDAVLDVDLTATGLYQWLREDLGVEPVGGYRRLEAVAASTRVAQHLEVRPGSPVMRMTATNEDQQRVLFEHYEAFYRSDRIAFELLVERPDARARASMRTTPTEPPA